MASELVEVPARIGIQIREGVWNVIGDDFEMRIIEGPKGESGVRTHEASVLDQMRGLFYALNTLAREAEPRAKDWKVWKKWMEDMAKRAINGEG